MTVLPSMALNMPRKSPFWAAPSFSSDSALTASSSARMKFWMSCLRSPRNMCSVRSRPDALGTLVGGELRIIGVVCVGTNADHATARLIETNLVSPSEDGLEIAAELGTDEGDLAQNDVTGGAVNGDDVTLVKHDVGNRRWRRSC